MAGNQADDVIALMSMPKRQAEQVRVAIERGDSQHA
jgi:hypothetical protein